MRRSELKKIVKSLVKECIYESLFQEGVLSSIIAEVTRGISPVLAEHNNQPTPPAPTQPKETNIDNGVRQKLVETKKKMMDAIGTDAYGGVDLFEGTRPIKKAGTPGAPSAPSSPLENHDPSDPGVDLGSFGISKDIWKKLL